MRSMGLNLRLWLVPVVVLSLGLLVVAYGPHSRTPSPRETPPPHHPPSAMKVTDATDRCLMPVADGQPTAADVGSASRMVEDPTALPNDDQPWMWGYNRGGQWTIDATGRYAPFPGRRVGQFGLPFIQEATTGRVMTTVEDEVLTFDHTWGFVPLAKVADQAGRSSVSLLRVERLDLTLLITRSAVRRLNGDIVEPWSEGVQVAGDGGIQAFDLPALHAILFLPADGTLKLRRDDGRWETLGLRDHDGRDYRVERVDQGAISSTALIWMRETKGPLYRLLGLFGDERDGSVRLLDAGPYDRYRERGGPQLLFSAATGEILRFRPPGPGRPLTWSRMTPTGYEPIPGGLAPRRDVDGFWVLPVHLPRQRAMAFQTDDGLALYQKGRMRSIPGPERDGLGAYPRIVDLPAISRTLIVSPHGLFELTSDDRIVRVEAPFSTGGWSPIAIFEDAKRRQAVIRGAEGLFTLDRRGAYRRIAAPQASERPYLDHVVTLSVSGDHLLNMDNALWLLTSPTSPRWEACRAQRGTGADRL